MDRDKMIKELNEYCDGRECYKCPIDGFCLCVSFDECEDAKLKEMHDIAFQDSVNHPSHYGGKIECIDYIRDKLGEGFVPYCIGNVIKYVTRYDKKGNPVEDLQKAQRYLEWAIEAERSNIES